MEVEAPDASFLVISQTNYPGWRVSVNDEPAHLYQTNFPGRGRARRAIVGSCLNSGQPALLGRQHHAFGSRACRCFGSVGLAPPSAEGEEPTPEWMPDPSRLSLNSIRGKF